MGLFGSKQKTESSSAALCPTQRQEKSLEENFEDFCRYMNDASELVREAKERRRRRGIVDPDLSDLIATLKPHK